jgi:purine nucleoside permease
MPVEPTVVVLPAFEELSAAPIDGEVGPWESVYDFTHRYTIDGAPSPLRYDPCGVGVVPTGIGKVAAATTTAALCASEKVSLENCLILSVGIAGAPPQLPIGSVVVADSIVDWDDKCRFDPTEDNATPIETDPYTGDQGVFDLDTHRVSWAESLSEDSQLTGLSGGPKPTVDIGTNVCADELWHGQAVAEHVAEFVSKRQREPYLVTEMEDCGTVAALDRFGLADQYLSIRGVSNHDRPTSGKSGRESLLHTDSGASDKDSYTVGLENAVSVASTLVADEITD